MNATLIAFSQLEHDDTIYAYCSAGQLELRHAQATFILYKDNVFHDEQSAGGHQQVVFSGLAGGAYDIEANLRLASRETLALNAPRMELSGKPGPAPTPLAAGAGPRKGSLRVDDKESPRLEVKFVPGGFERFIGQAEQLCATLRRLGTAVSFYPRFDPLALKNRANPHPSLDEFALFYRVKGLEKPTDFLSLAEELERLDLVAYCSIDEGHLRPPPPEADAAEAMPTPLAANAITPDFIPLQGYLRAMNVQASWNKRTNGRNVTVRHLDYGIFVNHEALYNVVAETNRPPSDANVNHGTASAGVIAGNNRHGGIKGIAHGCNLYNYNSGDDDLIVLQMHTGDVISINNQYSNGNFPMVHGKGWWENLQRCVEAGAVVIFAGGNGGHDLATAAGFNNMGDSGALLVGSCRSSTGLRLGSSNHNLYGALNAWGEHVVTAGYTSLQDLEGHDRDYTNTYNGTSAATPQCAACLALIQSYLFNQRGKMLTTAQMHQLNEFIGFKDAVGQGIGRRPNVTATLDLLYNESSDYLWLRQ